MEKYTIEMMSFTAMLAEKTATRYEWACYFTLKNDPANYRSIVFVDEYEDVELGWCWDSRSPEILLEYDQWEYCRGTSFNDPLFDYWRDHLFQQCVNVIKQHSKDRLRLLPYLAMEFADEEFVPLLSYPEPAHIKFIETL